MTLKQLRVLMAVHRHGSLQMAAAELNLSRSTASRLLSDLEEALGVKLLIRTQVGCSLTAAGEGFIEGAGELLASAEALRCQAAATTRDRAQRVILQLPVSLPEIAHVTALTLIQESLPEAQLDVRLFVEPEPVYSEDVHLRLQFANLPPVGPFRTFLLSHVPIRLMASPDYLAEHGTPTSVEALSQHRLLRWMSPSLAASHLPLKGGGSVEVRSTIESTDVSLLRTLAAMGQGIAFIPCARPEFSPSWQVFQEVLTDQIEASVSLRAVVPDKLCELSVTRSLIDVTRELSLLYNAGELVWKQG